MTPQVHQSTFDQRLTCKAQPIIFGSLSLRDCKKRKAPIPPHNMRMMHETMNKAAMANSNKTNIV
jgi:hypothetical protein